MEIQLHHSYLGISWKLVASFTPQLLCPRGNLSRYPLYRRLCGPQSRFGGCGEEKNLALAGNRNPADQPVACPYAGADQIHRAIILHKTIPQSVPRLTMSSTKRQ
jgi:hypothetical protein